jgi:uncharacterized membrane protein YbhN (UPF0104 family)
MDGNERMKPSGDEADEAALREAARRGPSSDEAFPGQRYYGRGRTAVGVVLGLVVSLTIVVVGWWSLADDTSQVTTHPVEPVLLVAAFACVAVWLAADALTLTVMARTLEPGVDRRDVALVGLRSWFIAGTTSFGGLEIPYQGLALRNCGLTFADATSIIVVKGAVHASILAVVAAASFVPFMDSPVTDLQREIVGVVLAVTALVWVVGSLLARRLLGLRSLRERFGRHLFAARVAFASFHDASRGFWFKVVGLQLLYWASMFAVIPLILFGLGWSGSIMPVVFGQALLQVAMPLSPLVGGTGIAELGYLALIGPLVPAGIRIESLVLWRVATWVVPVAVGRACLKIRRRQSPPGLEHSDHA